MSTNNIDIFDLIFDHNITYMDIEKSCNNGDLYEFDLNKDLLISPDGTLPIDDYIIPTINKCLLGNLIFSWNFAYNTNTFKDKIGRAHV